MSDADLIRRIDAMQACQVGPSDEWAKATKSGYNQAATDCARNILRIEPVATPTTEQIMADPRVQALVEALKFYAPCEIDGIKYAAGDDEGYRAVAALAQLKEPKP